MEEVEGGCGKNEAEWTGKEEIKKQEFVGRK